MTEPMLLDVTAAAKLLGVSDRAVKAAIASGQLRTVVLAKRKLVPRAAIEELISGEAGDVDREPDAP